MLRTAGSAIIVADVTGHGAGPAMLTAAVAMGLSVQADETRDDVVRRLERVNREVLIRCKGKATMTMTAVVIDQNTGEVQIYGLGGIRRCSCRATAATR